MVFRYTNSKPSDLPMIRIALLFCLLLTSGCTTYNSGVRNEPSARPSRYVSIDTPTEFGTTGIESQDIVGMAGQMVQSMLANPILVPGGAPKIVVVDSQYFSNDSDQRINKNLITDKLRHELHTAANGRMRFIARHASALVAAEQAIANGAPAAARPTDFRLSGRFQNLSDGDARGNRSNYVQVLFEMIDIQSGELVWSGLHEFKKMNRESIIYQ
jgi:penicillin-binding protein activator